ncbi:MAG TPA: LptF/LptG family permease [Flavobacteriales bacterium]|nr:LptF/LptG family permease [Flavobacteriales bacterium]HNU55448.1 LptF/LptG family permease [Flavobacteriales bacterium]
MFKTLDRYIIRQFLGTFFFILVVIMLIAVVFDISEKTEDFAKMSATTREIVVEFYLNFVIYYSNLFSGLLIFIAVLLFTSRLAHRTEVIAILSSGVSFPRIMWPYFLAATGLTILSLVVNHKVLPAANKIRLAFEERHIRVTYHVDQKNIHREIAPGRIAYFETYNAEHRTGMRFSLERWQGDSLVEKLSADKATYDSTNGSWHVQDYLIRSLAGADEHIRQGSAMDTVIPLKPSDMGQRWETSMAMTDSELDAYIAEKNAQGDDSSAPYLIEKHQRTSYPFATYVFTLIGVSIASRKVRGGTGLHLAAGVGLVLVYIFMMKLTTVAATNAGMDPFLAVWLPNILFAIVGIFIYRRAPK